MMQRDCIIRNNKIVAGPIADLPLGEVLRIVTDSSVPAIAVFNVDGHLYAVDDTCTHQDASLADGWLEGCFVECPLHSSTFDLRTGEPNSPPAREPLQTYVVRVDDGVIVIDLRVDVEVEQRADLG